MTSSSTNSRRGSGDQVREGVMPLMGKALCPIAISSSSNKNNLLNSRGYGQKPQISILNSQESKIYPDAGGFKNTVGDVSREVGGIGVMCEGSGSTAMQGLPSFCYGCSSWGFSYPVTAY